LIDERGNCGGRFRPSLDGSRVRVIWCSWSADYVELSRVIGIDEIFGACTPPDVVTMFQSRPDPSGRVYFYEVDRCPLAQVDPDSPASEPSWIDEVGDALRLVNIRAPDSWLPADPTPCLADGVVVLNSQIESASAWRTRKDEDW